MSIGATTSTAAQNPLTAYENQYALNNQSIANINSTAAIYKALGMTDPNAAAEQKAVDQLNQQNTQILGQIQTYAHPPVQQQQSGIAGVLMQLMQLMLVMFTALLGGQQGGANPLAGAVTNPASSAV